eukprot:scaffold434180_cov40-Prasinocladus_malaysianus.AAC.3
MSACANQFDSASHISDQWHCERGVRHEASPSCSSMSYHLLRLDVFEPQLCIVCQGRTDADLAQAWTVRNVPRGAR